MSTIFQYPVSTPTSTVTLPSPTFGDTERRPNSNVFGESRSNEILNVYDAGHPKPVTLGWKILMQSKDSRDEVLAFLETSQGDRIKVTDYNSSIFNAIVTSKDVSIETIRDECFYALSINLMVVT